LIRRHDDASPTLRHTIAIAAIIAAVSDAAITPLRLLSLLPDDAYAAMRHFMPATGFRQFAIMTRLFSMAAAADIFSLPAPIRHFAIISPLSRRMSAAGYGAFRDDPRFFISLP